MSLVLPKAAQPQTWVCPILSAAIGGSIGVSVLGITPSATAQMQIVPDGTLVPSNNLTDQNSVINPAGIVDGNAATLIEGGTVRGSNLFHSFQEFNVQTGQRVYFSDPANIDNILTRVTGSDVSNILGTLGIDGAANLFLLNPNGVIFGENAQLDIDGSFVSTTAESIDFGSDNLFSATNPQTVPLLTVNTPIGLQYGTATNEIRVEGSGSQVFFDFNTELTDKSLRPIGLEVPINQTLALLGGEVSIDGGNLTSAGGNIELAAITAGYLPLKDGTTGYLPFEPASNISMVDLPADTLLGDLLLTGGASIDASGNPPSNIRLLADSIEFNEGASLFMTTLGNADGGNLQAFAPSSIMLQGFGNTGVDPVYSSSWSTLVPAGVTGNGADVSINTGRLQILNGGFLLTETNGAGDAGNVTIQSEEVTVAEINPFVIISVLGSYVGVGGDGNGGKLTINTERLTLADASVTGVQTRGNGDAGNVTITATEFVEIDTQLPDFVPFPLLTRLSSEAAPITLFGTSDPPAGNSGDISITTPNLRILNGSQLSSSNSGTGDGGDIEIVANIVEVDGTGEILDSFISFAPLQITTQTIPSLISAVVADPGTGNAGDIRMTVDQLRTSNGGLLSNSALGNGTGGNVTITAQESIELMGTNAEGDIASGIYSRAVSGNGSGGDISLFTPQLTVQDGATVNVGNFDTLGTRAPGTGPAGNIYIEATTLQLSNNATLNADTLSGNQGNISLQATDLGLSENSRISTNADGTGSGGNLQVLADNVSVMSNSELVANANGTGDAGNIIVTAPQSLALSQSRITASGGQGNLSLTSPVIVLRENSLIATDARGTAAGGNIELDADFLVALENSDITANAEQSSGGRVVVNAQSIIGTDFRLQPTSESDITASSELGPDLNGTVELNTLDVDLTQGLVELSSSFSDTKNDVVGTCSDLSDTNSLTASGRGGAPADPSQILTGTNTWVDFRLTADSQPPEASLDKNTREETNASSPQTNLENPDHLFEHQSIVEAQSMVVENGEITLLAAAAQPLVTHSSLCSNSGVS